MTVLLSFCYLVYKGISVEVHVEVFWLPNHLHKSVQDNLVPKSVSS